MADRDASAMLLSIDVEDWFQVENLRPWFPHTRWDSLPPRVETNTDRLLDIFDSFPGTVKATFFVLGRVAERFPRLVRRIRDRGHEIASHGYNHELNYGMQRKALDDDLQKSKKLLEDISGQRVLGYRAPCFSISDDILKSIRDAGYVYDSSYNSFQRHGRYGTIDIDGRTRHGIAFGISDRFFELPISNLDLWGQTLPWGGGGYFRIVPPQLFRAGVRRILNRVQAYMLYLHPWEIDPDQPRVREVKMWPAFRHYVNLGKTHRRLHDLIAAFAGYSFITCGRYLERQIELKFEG